MVDILHPKCGGLVFYYDHVPRRDEVIEAEHATHPDGVRLVDGDPVICPKCGAWVPVEELLIMAAEPM